MSERGGGKRGGGTRGGGTRGDNTPEGPGAEGPSAPALRRSIVERVERIESRNVLLALDAVLSVQEPPFDAELSVEAMLGVAEMVAGMRLLTDAHRQRLEDEDEAHGPS